MSTVNQSAIKHKIGLLNLAQELGNVSKACKMMGFSRDTFYRYQHAKEEGGVEALFEANRRKPNVRNRVEQHMEDAVCKIALDQPAFGQTRVSNELRKEGLFISPAGVRCVWMRHDLESFKKRLKALEAKVAEEGILLTEAQLAALEKKKEDDIVHGEIETHHPGYLGSQDTFYVGTLKGVVAFISRPLWTLIPSGLRPSCTPPRPQLQERICSTTKCSLCLLNKVCQ